MDIKNYKTFYVIGIAIRTTNENQQSAIDIPLLWNRFLSENVMGKIPNKVSNAVYCIYTDYEKDFTRPYTTILGCEVSSLENVPEGMIAHVIHASAYMKFTAKGNLKDNIVLNKWVKIWNSDLPRAYTSDYEVYDERSHDSENAEVDIHIAVH